MFIEVCIISAGVHMGSRLYKKFVKKEKDMEKKPNAYSFKNKKPVWNVEKTPGDKIEKIEFDDKILNKFLHVSVAATFFAVAGALVYPPLSIISAIIILAACIPFFRIAMHAVFKERKARIEIVDSLATIVMLAAGYFVVTCLTCFAALIILKLRLKTERESKESLVNVFGNQPDHVWIVRGETELEIPFDSLEKEDIIVIGAGETVPADGIVIRGMASADQHMLTGEAQPVEKSVGDALFAATIVISGKIHMKAEKTGKDTAAAKIGEILNNTSQFTDYLDSEGKKMADATVIPSLLLVAGAAPFVGVAGTAALLCANCLSNVRILAPMGMFRFLKQSSSDGILIKDGRSLELLNNIDTVVFDKTGTLTMERPRVSNIHSFTGYDEEQILLYAASAEQKQKHPIAQAICAEAEKRGGELPLMDEAEYKIGYGITVKIGEKTIRAGSERFMENEKIAVPDEFSGISEKSYEEGCSLVCISEDGNMMGAVELEPSLRPESKAVINALKKRGMTICIISGDHEKPTEAMAENLGIDHYFAKVLPEEKASIVEKLQKNGASVCFAGDGINDSIALKKAEVSVSMTGASSVATDSAQIILMDQTLEKLPELFEIAEEFQGNMKNTFLASSYPTVFGIGGVFFANFHVMQMLILYMISALWGGAVALAPGTGGKGGLEGKKD